MAKTDQINQLLLETLAASVNQAVHLPGGLITITFVNCSPDLKSAHVGFSVLPDKLAGTAMRALRASTSQLIPLLKPRLRLRSLPHLIWEFDATERDAGRLERLIAEID